jgi:hypothetical protein
MEPLHGDVCPIKYEVSYFLHDTVNSWFVCLCIYCIFMYLLYIYVSYFTFMYLIVCIRISSIFMYLLYVYVSYCMFMYLHRASRHSSGSLLRFFRAFSSIVKQIPG